MDVVEEEGALALSAFHLQPVGLLICRRTGEIQLANRAACDLLELDSVAVGTPLDALLTSIETLEHLEQRGQPTIAVGSAQGELRQLSFRLTAGEGGVVLITLQPQRPMPWFRAAEVVEPSRPSPPAPAPVQRIHERAERATTGASDGKRLHGVQSEPRTLRAPAAREVERIMARRAGDGAAFTFADCLHLAAIGRHSVVVGVEDTTTARNKGWVILHDGHAWAARCGARRGDDAMRALLAAAAPRVEVEPLEADPGPREIMRPVEDFLIEALGLEGHDSSLERVEHLTTARPRPEEDTTGPAAFSFFMEAGLEAILARNYPQAWRSLRTAARLHPNHAGVRANLRRLAFLGHAPTEEPPVLFA